MFAVRQREGTSVVTPPPAWNATVNSSNATSTALPPVEGRVTVSAQSQHHRTRPALTFTPAYPVRDAAYACNVALLELRVGGLMSESGDANALLGDQWRRVVVVADTAKIDLWMHPPAIGALLQALHGVVAAHHLHVTLTGTGHTIDMLEAVNEPCAFVVRMNATESATAPVTADAVLDLAEDVTFHVLDRFAKFTRSVSAFLDPSRDQRPATRPSASTGRPSASGHADPSANATPSNQPTPLDRDWDDMSRAYFERWARSVRSDTHRMLREEQRRQHKAKDASESKSNKAPGPGFGVAVLLDEDLVVSMETACGEFELVTDGSDEEKVDETTSATSKTQQQPLTLAEWSSYLDHEGRLTAKTESYIRTHVVTAGIAPNARSVIWPFLLDLFPWDSTAAERALIVHQKVDDYVALRARWMHLPEGSSDDADMADLLLLIAERRHRVEKDVVRTDRSHPFYAGADTTAVPLSSDHGSSAYIEAQLRAVPHLCDIRDILLTYALYNIEVGYVQGMSDLLAPLYACTGASGARIDVDPTTHASHCLIHDANVAWTFWLFERLLRRHQGRFSPANIYLNFHMDQSGIRSRLVMVTYLLRLLCPRTYTSFEEMDLFGGDGDTGMVGTGVTSLLWLFRGVLTLFKRELTRDEGGPGGLPEVDAYYANVHRVWETLLALQPMNPWCDVWITVAIIEAYVAPYLGNDDTAAGTDLHTFEDLLQHVNRLRIEPGPVLAQYHRLVRRFRRRIPVFLSASSTAGNSSPTATTSTSPSSAETTTTRDAKLWTSGRTGWDAELARWSREDRRRGTEPPSSVRITLKQALRELMPA